MAPYEDNNEGNPNSESFSEDPIEDGEYHFTRPDQHRSYSDAGYTPQSEVTAPPRYHLPEDKPPKEKKQKSNGQITFGKVVALCLVCALIGGLGGGALTGYYLNSSSEEAVVETVPVLSTAASPTPTVSASTILSGGISGSDIYSLGCDQAVGITTDISTTNYFGMPVSGSVSGSGFIITEDGYIMTNYHVIEDAYEGGYEIKVMLYDGTEYTAEITGFDSDNDIAVLKIDAEGLSAVTFGNSGTLGVGDTVYAIGNPLGELSYTMTSGIVSATDRVITTDESTSINMFQFDAAVNSGNSGGPLYNSLGQVVGVVTAKYSETGVEGLGFAIPINDAVDIANELITNGYVTGKPSMGIEVQTVSASVAQYYNLVLGAFVYSINSGSCADIAGLKAGDIITAMDGVEITTTEDLKAALKQHSAADTVDMTVYRSGEYLTLSITFDEQQPESTTASAADDTQTSEPSGYPYGRS
ncbi:MAG: trypsin-like serine protease [Clostridia bacterium]|nr:trypsin-like serine protease [Clostridia bacterium]NCC68015.1 trypsin-like serine protease [Clostridia bacterium]